MRYKSIWHYRTKSGVNEMDNQRINPWWRVFLPFAIGYYLSYVLRNVNAVIAPELQRDLGITAADLGLLTSAYLLAFGTFQLPLGLLLDRYGPRRVEAGLLIFAGLGCAAFAFAENLPGLVSARAVIGLGVSSCLMASFKAFSLWFPKTQQAALNAAVMAAGGLGALTATMPLGWALPVTGWRGIFWGLTGLAFLAATLILSTPEKHTDRVAESFRDQLHALQGILRSPVFWRFAPQTTMFIGGFIAMQGLWAVPYLIGFNGENRDGAAFHLLLSSIAMLVGFITLALSVVPLSHRGIMPVTILKVGVTIELSVAMLIVLGIGPTKLLWFALGLCFTVGNLAYALLCSRFPSRLFGRVNTALNLTVFIGAFSIQWGFGALLDALRRTGLPTDKALQLTYGVLLVLQIAAFLWFATGDKRAPLDALPDDPVTVRGVVASARHD